MKLPKMLYKYAMKYPFVAGLVVFALYMGCAEYIMLQVRDLVNTATGALEAPKEKDEKAEEQAEPEMVDPSMFSQSLKYNATIANVDAQLEDLVNDVHP